MNIIISIYIRVCILYIVYKLSYRAEFYDFDLLSPMPIKFCRFDSQFCMMDSTDKRIL